MRYTLSFFMLWFVGVSLHAQSIILDIEYQPNTTYEWTQEYHYDNWSETFGDDDYKQSMERNGIDISGQTKGVKRQVIRMTTSARDQDYIPFQSVIIENLDSVETERNRFNNQSSRLETEDLIYHGRINRFQKMEIDSIIGVDSLSERNRAFALLDDIHRSIAYPKDTFLINQKIIKSKDYGYQRNGVAPAIQDLTYQLNRIEGSLAYFDLTIQFYQTPNESKEERKVKISGSGQGVLIYDLENKLIKQYEYHVETNQYYDSDFVSNEYLLKTKYIWKTEIVGRLPINN